MKKRLLWSAFAMTVLVLLGFFAPLLYWRITGLVRGEAFYEGKPSCYWREAAKEHIKRNKDDALLPILNPPSWRDSFRKWKNAWFPPEYVVILKMTEDPEAIPVWRDLFHDRDDNIRALAAVRITVLGENAPDMIPGVVHYLMTEANENEAWIIARCMGNFDRKLTVPLLCTWLNRDDKSASLATTALGNLFDGAEEAIPLLIKNMEKENDRGASSALPWIGPKSIPALKKLLRSENIYARRNATDALTHWRNGGLPDNFPDLDDLLVQQSRDPDPSVRLCALRLLLWLPEKNAEALYSVANMLHDPDAKVRAAAIRTITTASLNPNVPELRAILAEIRNLAVFDENAEVRTAAKNAVEIASPAVRP